MVHTRFLYNFYSRFFLISDLNSFKFQGMSMFNALRTKPETGLKHTINSGICMSENNSDFVTFACCIFWHNFVSGMQIILLQRVPGCNGIADLSLRIMFWTHSFAVGLIDTWETESPRTKGPKIVNESLK